MIIECGEIPIMNRGRKSLLVVGATVVDIIARAGQLPKEGQTVLSNSPLIYRIGGKGYNQAVFAGQAVRRYGGEVTVTFCSSIGKDVFGRLAQSSLEAHGVKPFLHESERATGIGFIQMNSKNGENQIVVSTGANADILESFVEGHAAFADIILAQLEIDPKVSLRAFEKAPPNSIRILNGAPLETLTLANEAIIASSNILILNEIEASVFGIGIDSHLNNLFNKYPSLQAIIITLGPNGVKYARRGHPASHIHGTDDIAVDAIGAGDCFVSHFAVGLLQNGKSIPDAIVGANFAAGKYVAYEKPSSNLTEVLR